MDIWVSNYVCYKPHDNIMCDVKRGHVLAHCTNTHHTFQKRKTVPYSCLYSIPACGCGDVLGRLAHVVLKDTQAFSQTAECGCRCGFEQEQVLVQGGQRPAAWQRLDGINQVLLLAFCLGHDLKKQINRQPSHRFHLDFWNILIKSIWTAHICI